MLLILSVVITLDNYLSNNQTENINYYHRTTVFHYGFITGFTMVPVHGIHTFFIKKLIQIDKSMLMYN